MTTLIKLTEPGSYHTLTVSGVTVDSGGKWPDYNLTDGINTVVIPKSAADRQLERLKLASAFDLIGSTVKVSRSEKPGANGKHFWNLDIVNVREAQPAKPSQRVPTPYVPPTTVVPPRGHAGAHIPEMDGPYQDESPHHDPMGQDSAGDAQRFPEPPLTAREQREQVAGVSDRERAYLACWARVARELATICKQHGIPLDASAVQATTFSVMGSAR